MSGFDNGGSAPPPPPPPSAGGGGAIPPRGLGDILSTAFEIYRANAAKLITIVAVVVVPLTFIGALLSKVLFKQSCDASNAQTLQDLQNAVNKCVGSGGRTWFLAALATLISVAMFFGSCFKAELEISPA